MRIVQEGLQWAKLVTQRGDLLIEQSGFALGLGGNLFLIGQRGAGLRQEPRALFGQVHLFRRAGFSLLLFRQRRHQA